MVLVDSLTNATEANVYGYSYNKKGDIEIDLKISKEGDYRLIISEKDLKALVNFKRLRELVK
jgi:two-component sensor histidine kinase